MAGNAGPALSATLGVTYLLVRPKLFEVDLHCFRREDEESKVL